MSFCIKIWIINCFFIKLLRNSAKWQICWENCAKLKISQKWTKVQLWDKYPLNYTTIRVKLSRSHLENSWELWVLPIWNSKKLQKTQQRSLDFSKNWHTKIFAKFSQRKVWFSGYHIWLWCQWSLVRYWVTPFSFLSFLQKFQFFLSNFLKLTVLYSFWC